MTAEVQARPTGLDAVAAWRLKVLEKVFAGMFFLLAALLIVETLLSLESGRWHAIPALSLGVLLQGIAAFARGLGVRARAGVFSAASWVGLGLALPVLGFGLPIPFVVAAMTLTLLALCVSRRFALTNLVGLVAILLAGATFICFVRGPAPPELVAQSQLILDPTRFGNWIRVIGVFAAVGVAIIGSVGYLVRRLEEAILHNRELFDTLQETSREKIHALEHRQILEDKVRRAGELQVLGLLSATVAHDFNNLLMVILGNASSLKLELDGRAKEDIVDIESAGQQAADLCRRLLTLAGERMSGDELAELNQVVEAELPLLRRVVTKRISLEWTPGPPLWLRCARTEMRQALLNLCANARDAMPKGGRIRLSTASVERARPGQTNPTAFGCLVIADEGTGMDQATRERIFEPFFTTKDKAKGTGLGMPLVAAAVERQNGFLELDTAPGKGTAFSLFFPLVEAPSEVAAPAPRQEPSLDGRLTVLVVDDDEGARKILSRYLQKHGYTVLLASDGREALDVFRRTEGIALVVSDAVMPRMDGRALFDAVSKERPAIPFLFCSGFPAGTISAEILDSPHRDLLPKPFTEEALLDRVRQLLAGRRR